MSELIARCTARTCLVLLTVFIASVVPYFSDILQLVSSMSIVAVVFIFPPWFFFLLFRHRGFEWSEIFLMVFLALFGVMSMVVGMYYAIKGLTSDINQHPNPFQNYF